MSPFATVLFVLTCAAMAAFVVACAAVALRRVDPARRRRAWVVALAALSIPFVWGLVLLPTGFLERTDLRPPAPLVLVAPAMILGLLLATAGRRHLAAVPLWWLVAAQAFRVPVEIVLWLAHGAGKVPVQMTFEGLNFDILVGLSAPVMAVGLARGAGWARALLPAWTLGGVLLLVNIVTIAVLSVAGPTRMFLDGPPNTLVLAVPYVWLPSFLVPMALFLHVAVARRLMSRRSAGTSGLAGAPVR